MHSHPPTLTPSYPHVTLCGLPLAGGSGRGGAVIIEFLVENCQLTFSLITIKNKWDDFRGHVFL